MAPKSAGSVSSYGQSEASSANGSDTQGGLARGDDGGGDLLSRGKGSKKEAFFSVLYFIFSGRLLETDWRFLLLSTLFVWAQTLNLLFGPNFFGWTIDWDGNNWWRFYKRLLLSNAAVERGWGVYVGVLLVFVIASILAAAIPAWLNHYMKARVKLRWKWPGHLLRVFYSIVRVFYVSIISLLTVSFTCNNDTDRTMFYFPDKGCFVMPQVILFVACLVVEVLLLYPTLLGLLVEAGDTSYYSKNFFSTSVGPYLVRLSLVRMALPLVPAAFQLYPKWQASGLVFFNFLLTSYYLYITIRRAPMHRTWLNCVNAFLALFPWWAASLAFIGVFYPQYWHRLTTAFLAGMFPLGFVCAGITYWRLRFIWDVAELFKGWTPRTPRRETYRFWDEYEVEMVARVCRKTVKTDQLDIVPDPYYASLADKVVQAGLLQFPDSAFLNIVYASLQAVLLNDPSGGVNQLQKAKNCTDIGWVQRFQVYVREQEKLAQKGQDADHSVTFDAATWSEFSANYKAAIRSHRAALTTLKAFWHLLLRADVSLVALVRLFLRIPASKDAAEHSYKALMERYPNNPKVMRAYSRFLQQVKNDPHGASRFANLANKAEERQEESWREDVFGQLMERTYLDEKSTRTMAMIDETLDAVVMINSEGMIQHVNQPALKMFGYRKGEADGANISALMPAPFSQQHASYIRNYLVTRQPRILNRTVEVVGLHKAGHVFAVEACVTPIMMAGAECFLGVVKALDDESRLATVYCTSSGSVVCANRGFTNLLAHQSVDIVGRSFGELTTTPDKANAIMEEVAAGDGEPQFGEEISMDVVGRKAGTGNVPICVLELSNDGNAFTGLISVSKATGRITYANASFCEFVGISADQLIKMRLHEVIAEPYSMLHQRWIKSRDLSRAPGLRCRAGRAVEFKHGSSGKAVTAMLEISEHSTDQGNMFNVKVAPVTETVDKEWNRVSVTVAQDGTITGHTGRLALFGLEKEVMVGKGLDALLDLYNKEGEELGATHTRLLQDLRNRPRTLRVAVALRGKRSVPAVLDVVLPAEEAQEAPATMHIYRADCLEGIIELDVASKVKKVNDEAALVFGMPASRLVGENIQKVLPRACPGGRTTELLAAHGQRGGSKQKVGAPQAAEGVHPDKHSLHVTLQAAESTERPGRYLVRIVVPKPISAYSTINRAGITAAASPAASAPGSAAGEGAPSSRGVALSGCPFSLGSKGASLAAAGSRPATGGSACPINLNTEEVLASLAFPPSSRFAIEKAQVEATARLGTVQTDSEAATAAAVAAAAVAAAVAAIDLAQQDGSAAGDGRDPNVGYNSRVQGPSPAEGDNAAALMRGQSGMQGMTASDEAAGEGGAEEEMDPAELAAKMDGVRAWLETTATPPKDQSESKAADAAAFQEAMVPILGEPEPEDTELAVVTQEPAGRQQAASAGRAVRVAVAGDRSTVEGSSMGGSDTGSLVASDADEGADYSRLKRFKKAYKLLNSSSARQAINRLRVHVRLVLLFMVAAHIAFFAAALVTVNSCMGFIVNIDKAGSGARDAIAACTDLRNIQYGAQEIKSFSRAITYPDPSVIVVSLLQKAHNLEASQNELYFSKGSAAADTAAMYDGTMLNVSVYMDVQPTPFIATYPLSLWDAIQRMINAFKDVAAMTQAQWFDLENTFSFRYAMDNVPRAIAQALLDVVDMELFLAVQKLEQVGKVTWALLGVEAGFVIPLAAFYILWLLYQVAIERFNLFSIFLFIPRPAVLALARAEVVVDELDDSDDEEEEMGAGGHSGGASGALSTAVNAKTLAQKAAQDRLAISRRSILWLMLPFAVWLVIVIACWSAQYYLITASRDRAVALELSERQVLFAQRAQFYYELGLYGNANPYRQLDMSLSTIKVNVPIKGTLFSSVPQNKLLFNEQCLRLNQSNCFTKDNPYYWTTNMGLNTLMATDDANGGWTQSNSIFMYVSNFDTARAVQGVVLAIAIVGPLAFFYYMALPFVRLTLLESRKVAEVLSYLPQGVDVASLLEIANVHVSSSKKKKGPGSHTSTQSADEELDD
ncbi:hypothetical protein N2152v2_006810 [Parachlorella kessleri]